MKKEKSEKDCTNMLFIWKNRVWQEEKVLTGGDFENPINEEMTQSVLV